MQNIKNNINNVTTKVKAFNFKLWGTVAGVIFLLVAGFMAVVSINNFFDKNYFQFNRVLTIILQKPIEIKQRKPIVQKIILDYPHEVDTPIKKYICDKFGTFDCKTALAINSAEGNFQDEVFHVNTNGSVDFGCWQINSIHIRLPSNPNGTITMKDALDCQKSTDWAYNKFIKDGGWGAWVAYLNGSYLIKMGAQ